MGDEVDWTALSTTLQGLSTQLRTLGNRPHLPYPQYRGRCEKRSWNQFLTEVNDIASAQGWREEDLAELLPSMLKDEARSIYTTLDDTVKKDWRAVIDEMGKRLAVKDLSQLQTLALSRRQKPDEPIATFANEVKQLVERAFTDSKGYKTEQREEMSINIFRKGLKRELRAVILRAEKKPTLQECVDQAMAEEMIQQDLARESATAAQINSLTQKVNALQLHMQAPARGFGRGRGGYRGRGGRGRGAWRGRGGWNGQTGGNGGQPAWQPQEDLRGANFTPLPDNRPYRMGGGNGGAWNARGGRGGRQPNNQYRINAVEEGEYEEEESGPPAFTTASQPSTSSATPSWAYMLPMLILCLCCVEGAMAVEEAAVPAEESCVALWSVAVWAIVLMAAVPAEAVDNAGEGDGETVPTVIGGAAALEELKNTGLAPTAWLDEHLATGYYQPYADWFEWLESDQTDLAPLLIHLGYTDTNPASPLEPGSSANWELEGWQWEPDGEIEHPSDFEDDNFLLNKHGMPKQPHDGNIDGEPSGEEAYHTASSSLASAQQSTSTERKPPLSRRWSTGCVALSLMLLLGSISIHSATGAEQFNMCTYPQSREIRPIPPLRNCTPPVNKWPEEKGQVELWIRKLGSRPFQSFLCSRVQRRWKVEATLKWLDQDTTPLPANITAIEEEQCWELLKSRILEEKILKRKGLGHYETETKAEFDYPWFESYITTVDDFQVLVHNSYAHSNIRMTSTAPQRVSHCRPTEGSCKLKDGVLVWKKIEQLGCPYERKGTYEAIVTEREVLIPTLQAAIVLLGHTNRTECFPPHTFRGEGDNHVTFLEVPHFVKEQRRQQEEKAKRQATRRRSRQIQDPPLKDPEKWTEWSPSLVNSSSSNHRHRHHSSGTASTTPFPTATPAPPSSTRPTFLKSTPPPTPKFLTTTTTTSTTQTPPLHPSPTPPRPTTTSTRTSPTPPRATPSKPTSTETTSPFPTLPWVIADASHSHHDELLVPPERYLDAAPCPPIELPTTTLVTPLTIKRPWWHDDAHWWDNTAFFDIYDNGKITSLRRSRDSDSPLEEPEDFSAEGEEEEDPAANRNLNLKLQYLHTMQQRSAATEYVRLHVADCERENQQVGLILELLERDPTAAMRIYTRRSNITAKLRGDTVVIYECLQVPAALTEVFWDMKLPWSGKCFNRIPVRVKGEIFFMRRIGEPELVADADEVECATVEPPILALDGQYRSEGRAVAVEEWPALLMYSPSDSLLVFNASTIYRDGEELRDRLDFLLSRTAESLYDQKALRTGTILGPHPDPRLQEKPADVVAEVTEKISTLKDRIVSWWESWCWMVYAGIAVVVGIAILVVLIYLQPYLSLLMCCLPSKPVVRAVVLQPSETEELAEFRRSVRLQTYLPPSYSIYSVAGHRQVKVQIQLEGWPLVALWDDGSSITYMRRSTLLFLGMESKLKTTRFPAAEAANKTTIPFLGEIPLTIQLGEVTLTIPVRVSEDDDCPAPILLGTDTLFAINRQGYDVYPNLVNDVLVVRRVQEADGIPLVHSVAAEMGLSDKLWSPEQPVPMKVRISEKELLEPRSDTFLWAELDAEVPENVPVVVEDAGQIREEAVTMGRTLYCPGKLRRVPVRLMNVGNCSVPLYKGMVIGVAMLLASTIGNGVPLVHQVREYISPELRWDESLPRYPDPQYDPLQDLRLEEACLTDKAKKALRDIVGRHIEAFVGRDGKIGTFQGRTTHRIDLLDESKVVQRRPYPMSPLMKPEIEKQVLEMLRQHVIQRTDSVFSSPILLVPKADKCSWRFVIDYRELNSNTRKSVYILPLISEIVNEIGSKQLYSTFDMHSGFHQLLVHPEHRHRTAFSCFLGCFEFIRMPFGVTGGPGSFTKAMEEVKQHLTSCCLIYLDDIIIGSENENKHLSDIEELLRTLVQFGLKLKMSKCSFARAEVRYLGYLLSARGIRPDPKNVSAVANFKAPRTQKELKSLIGALSYFRRFIPRFAEHLHPLLELVKAGEDIREKWGEKQENALKTITKLLTTAPTLASPQFGHPFRVETDASKVALGACLLQADPEGLWRPVSYASRKLNRHEANYTTLELEGLAVVFAMKTFRMFTEGSGTVEVYTDNSALRTVLLRRDLSGRMARFQVALQGFDYRILHRSGTSNKFCDYLSRWTTEEGAEEELVVASLALDENESPLELLQRRTAEDPTLTKVVKEIQLGWRNDEDAELAPYRAVQHELEFREGVLERDGRIVVPTSMRESLLDLLHRSHMGRRAMKSRATPLIWWPGLPKAIDDIAAECETCGAYRAKPPQVPLHQWKDPSGPWKRIHIDFAECGGEEWLVTVDAYSKFPFIRKMSSTTSSATITALEELFAVFGNPNKLVSDNGPQLVSCEFAEMVRRCGIVHLTGAPFHPQTNGLVERFNRTWKSAMEKVCGGRRVKTSLLNAFLADYRSSTHTTTKETPAKLFLRRELRGELHALRIDQAGSTSRRAEARRKQKAIFDQGTREREYRVGQPVWVANFSSRDKRKFLPGRIVSFIGTAQYEVEVDGSVTTRHADQLQARRERVPRATTPPSVQAVRESEPPTPFTVAIVLNGRPYRARIAPEECEGAFMPYKVAEQLKMATCKRECSDPDLPYLATPSSQPVDHRIAEVSLNGEMLRLRVATLTMFPDYVLIGAIELSDVGPGEFEESTS